MSTARPTPPAAPGVNADTWTLLGLALAVLWVYLPLGLLRGGSLYGSDFISLHVRRLDFIRRELFGPSHHLPAWYPREFLGTPFWSNVQNFPFLPTRLPLLLVDPWTAYGVGVNVAAVLAAAFTYLFARRLGLGRLGAASAGWTFACCGFFASRVMAGHLPLLEAYPALPLLLWLVERYVSSDSSRALRLNLLALGAAAGAVMLAGHPQLPLYAVAAALLYLPVRAWGRAGMRSGLSCAAAMAAGVVCASFALYPMALLVGRSTRVLRLAPAANDFSFPLWRLNALLWPWADGWPSIVPRGVPHVPFMHTNELVFWDTVCYVGWLPLAAVLGLALYAMTARRAPKGPWLFIALAGTAALFLALPTPWGDGRAEAWTVLRSPARQLYLTAFALALAAGAAIDALLRLRPRLSSGRAKLLTGAVILLVAAHALDLRRHAANFVMVIDPPVEEQVSPAFAQALGDGRAAIDTELVHPLNRRVDDVGVFDSILLARPYRALVALSGLPPETNAQLMSGPQMGTRALQWSGVTVLMTTRGNLDLPVIVKGNWLNLHTVPGPLPRAGFVPQSGVTYADDERVLAQLRSGTPPSPQRLFLPPAAGPPAFAASGDSGATVTYRRPGTDQIELDVSAPVNGYVRVLEAFDPGWTATVDARPMEIVPADGFVMAVPVGPGTHVVRLTYHTPGVGIGLALSAAGVLMLVGIVAFAPRFAGTVTTA